MKRPPAVFRPMTDPEHALALALSGCRFCPASMSKRFARQLRTQAETNRTITDRQARLLHILAYTFRRQIAREHPELVPVNPPEGYETKTQREARHRYEQHLRAHSAD